MLLKQNKMEADEAVKMTAVILSWGIYGASVEWKRNGMKIPPEEYIKSGIPYLMAGIDFGS